MEICPYCKQEFKDIRALKIHVTVVHIAYKIADIEKQLTALEKVNQGSILGLIDTVNKSFASIWKAISAMEASSFERDGQLLEELKVIIRDSSKHPLKLKVVQKESRKVKQSRKVKV